MTTNNAGSQGTLLAPKVHEGPTYSEGDVRIHVWWLTYQTEEGLVASEQLNLIFTIDAPAKEVWPHLRDLNLWQNEHGYFYDGVIGEMYNREDLGLGTETFRLSIRQEGKPEQTTGRYQVLKVIPEHLIVMYEQIEEPDHFGIAGNTGGVSPGFHVFGLSEHDGKTIVTYQGEHARRATDETEEEMLVPWREFGASVVDFWRDTFIPSLTNLVYASRDARS